MLGEEVSKSLRGCCAEVGGGGLGEGGVQEDGEEGWEHLM